MNANTINFDANTIYLKHQSLKQTITDILNYCNIPQDIINIIISFYWNIKLFSNIPSFALLSPDGTVDTWGYIHHGGDSSGEQHLLKNVVNIQSTITAFAALTDNGTVVSWGDSRNGGEYSSLKPPLNNVKTIHSNGDYTFMAIRADGSLVRWGGPVGNCTIMDNINNVKYIHSHGDNSYVAITDDGKGHILDLYETKGSEIIPSSEVQDQMTNISTIYHNRYSYAVLKRDGTVVTWGDSSLGGNSMLVANKLKNVVSIASTMGAYIALLQNGTIIEWGFMNWRGDRIQFIAVQDKLIDIVKIYSTKSSYLALSQTGNVVTWGIVETGGDCSIYEHLLNNIVDIYSNLTSFLAIRNDETVIIWGEILNGSGRVFKRENDTIKSVHKTSKSFAILYKSGTLILVKRSCEKTYHDIETIMSCYNAYMFVRKNGMLKLKKMPL